MAIDAVSILNRPHFGESLPGGSSLAQLVAEYRAIHYFQRLPQLTVDLGLHPVRLALPLPRSNLRLAHQILLFPAAGKGEVPSRQDSRHLLGCPVEGATSINALILPLMEVLNPSCELK